MFIKRQAHRLRNADADDGMEKTRFFHAIIRICVSQTMSLSLKPADLAPEQ
jgi:hypothetical protein